MTITIPLVASDGATSTITIGDPPVSGTAQVEDFLSTNWSTGVKSLDGVWQKNGVWIGTGSNQLDPARAIVVPSVSGDSGTGYMTLEITPSKSPLQGAEIQTVAAGRGYGYYEARMMPSSVSGGICSFFLIGSGYANPEFDIEFPLNIANSVYFTAHPFDSSSFLYNLGFNPAAAFHRYGILWVNNGSTASVSFTVDGAIIRTRTAASLLMPPAGMLIMANCWSGNANFGGGPPTQNSTSYYDWIRSYPGATTVINPAPGAPSVPTGLLGTATGTTVAQISWNASTETGGTIGGYDVYRDSINIGTTATPVFNDIGLTNGSTYSYTVDAFDTTGHTSAQSMALVYRQSYIGSVVGGGLPPGVTLQAIDGETLTNNIQSLSYFYTNGFTNAHNAGLDSSTFFPNGAFFATLSTQAQANIWAALGWNTVFNGGSATASLLYPTNTLYLIDDTNGGGTLVFGSAQNTAAYFIGIDTFDEPGSYSQATSSMTSLTTAQSGGKFFYTNNTWTHIYAIAQNAASFDAFLSGGGFTGTGKQQVTSALAKLFTPSGGGAQVNLKLQSIDCYWFAGCAPSANWTSGQFFGGTPYEAGLTYTNTGTTGSPGYTVDQTCRACHYGDVADVLRSVQAPAPLITYIETGQPYEATGYQYYITPPQMNAAAWNWMMHGGRMISWFDHTFDPNNTSDNQMYTTFATTIQNGTGAAVATMTNWGAIGGGGTVIISIYNQMIATTSWITALYPVITSPWAMNYASVSPAGWKYGQSAMQGTASNTLSGFDICAKYYTGGNTNLLSNGFYVFVMPRYSQSSTNQTATITLADTNATSAVAIVTAIPAAASWTTSNSTITMASVNNGLVANGMSVYDATTGFTIGTVSSYTTSSTTLTLSSNASHASSGSADVLLFLAAPITISAGVFTDTFADGNTVKIYQIAG